MEQIFIVREEDIKQWVREAIKECMENIQGLPQVDNVTDEPLISRVDTARKCNISTNTLATWAKNGLPHYRNKRKVSYLYSEVLEYMRKNKKNSF